MVEYMKEPFISKLHFKIMKKEKKKKKSQRDTYKKKKVELKESQS